MQSVTINTPSPSPNTDGIDVSGTNMIFRDLNISCGDDNLVFSAGAGSGGPETANISVTNCAFCCLSCGLSASAAIHRAACRTSAYLELARSTASISSNPH